MLSFHSHGQRVFSVNGFACSLINNQEMEVHLLAAGVLECKMNTLNLGVSWHSPHLGREGMATFMMDQLYELTVGGLPLYRYQVHTFATFFEGEKQRSMCISYWMSVVGGLYTSVSRVSGRSFFHGRKVHLLV